MASAGQGWRQMVAIILLAYVLVVFFATIYCIRFLCHRSPINTHSPFLLCAVAVSSLINCHVVLVEVGGEDFLPCWLYYWLFSYCTVIYGAALLLSAFRLIQLHRFNQIKSSIRAAGNVLSNEQVQLLLGSKRWFKDSSIRLLYFGQLLFFGVLFIGIQFSDSHYTTSASGCRVGPPPFYSGAHIDRLDICWLVLFSCYDPLCLWSVYHLYKIRKSGFVDTLGLMKELLVVGQLLVFAFVGFFLAKWLDYDEYMLHWNWIWFAAMTPTLHCTIFVLYPIAKDCKITKAVRSICQRLVSSFVHCGSSSSAVAVSNTENLTCISILQDRRGFAFLMAQARNEFCEETVWCLQAVWQYKAAASFSGMMALYNQYIEDGAPLQVNISATCRERIAAAVDTVEATARPSSSRLFSEVEQELMKLLENNTFRRFQNSDLYRRFLHGETIDADEQERELTSHRASMLCIASNTHAADASVTAVTAKHHRRAVSCPNGTLSNVSLSFRRPLFQLSEARVAIDIRPTPSTGVTRRGTRNVDADEESVNLFQKRSSSKSVLAVKPAQRTSDAAAAARQLFLQTQAKKAAEAALVDLTCSSAHVSDNTSVVLLRSSHDV